jgi:hypothetical protein
VRGARPGDPVEQLRTLIDECNAGSPNVDEMLRRLQSLSREPSADEQRIVSYGLSDRACAVRPSDEARSGAD